jgi:hypothetical protein
MTQAAYRIWITGRGGQGVKFLAELLNQVFFAEKKHSWMMVSCDWAIRGGVVTARVFADARPQRDWEPSQDYNVLLSLHPAHPPHPPCLASDALILDATKSGAYEQAHQKNALRSLNLIILGQLLVNLPLCSEDLAAWVLKQKLGPTRLKYMPVNLEMLELGTQLGRL